MLQLVPCPACQRLLVVRDGVSLNATLKCPACQEQYMLEQLLREHCVHWEVVDDPTPLLPALSSPDSAARVVEVPDSHDEFELQLAPEAVANSNNDTLSNRSSTSRADANSRTNSSATKVDWSKYKPISHDEFQRMRRKATSPWWTIIQVVLGGIAAVPVSLLLIWHVVGTDIADAGPTVAKYLPWLVPERLRPNREEDWPEISQLGDPHVEPPSESTDPDEAVRPDANRESTPAAQSGTSTDNLTSPNDKTGNANQAEASPAQKETVFSLIDQCEDSLANWDVGKNGDTPQRRKLAQALYGSLTKLADAFESIPDTDPTRRSISRRLDRLARDISRNASAQTVIAAGAKAQLASPRSETTNGLALIVKIDRFVDTGAGIDITGTPQAPGTAMIPPIRLAGENITQVVVGRTLLILGDDFRDRIGTEKNNAPSEAVFEAVYTYAW